MAKLRLVGKTKTLRAARTCSVAMRNAGKKTFVRRTKSGASVYAN